VQGQALYRVIAPRLEVAGKTLPPLTPDMVMCRSVISAQSKWKKFINSIVLPSLNAAKSTRFGL
jgi:hypothetical protein